MKKLIVALLCAIAMCALLQPAVLAASESIEIYVNGRSLNMPFDRSEQFSNITDGNVQASFYTYVEDDDLYELYLIFPEDVQPGTTIDPAYASQNAPETSVVMIITTPTSVNYYFAGHAEANDGTDYAITFDSVADTGTGRTYTGTLSASMVGMAADTDTEIAPLTIDGARFSFTMPLGGPDDGDAPDDSQPPADMEPYGDDDPFANPTPAPTRETYRV